MVNALEENQSMTKGTKQTTIQTTKPRIPGQWTPAHGRGQLNTVGTPGNKGGGRPPTAYKQFLAECLEDEVARQELQAVLRDSKHPAYGAVLGKALLHVLGAPSRGEPGEAPDGPSVILLDLG